MIIANIPARLTESLFEPPGVLPRIKFCGTQAVGRFAIYLGRDLARPHYVEMNPSNLNLTTLERNSGCFVNGR